MRKPITMNDFKFEIKKFLQMKSLYYFLIFLFFFTVIISLSAFYSFEGDKLPTNYLALRIIPLNANLYVPIIISFYTARIFSVEYENNIMFALQLHNKNIDNIYLLKTVMAIIYISIAYFIQLFSALLIEKIFHNCKIDFNFYVNGSKIIFEQRESIVNIIMLYFNQFIGTLFIFEIFVFFLLSQKSFLKSSVLTIFLVTVIDVLYIFFSSRNFDLRKYHILIPFNAEYTWRNLFFLNFGDIDITLITWSFFLIIINMIIMHKNSIRRGYFE